MKAFFSRERGQEVVDQKCKCGHAKTQHGSVLKSITGDRKLRLPHDGSCCAKNCECLHFSWSGWLTAAEVSNLQIKCEKVNR